MFLYLSHMSPGWLILGIILLFIGLISQIALYAKAGKPGFSALVPVWNVVVFLGIVGRPKLHALWILVPGTICLVTFILFFPQFDAIFPPWEIREKSSGFGSWTFNMDELMIPLSIMVIALVPMFVFIAKVFTEICDSFGKHKRSDKIYAVLFNGAYMLFNIGISQAVYEGPWYAKKHGLSYEMPDLKGRTNKESKSEVLDAIAAKYKKKK